jgi:dolichol-phosphate mannosyltransferase
VLPTSFSAGTRGLPRGQELCVVVPVFNEAPILARVIEEWVAPLSAATSALSLCLLDDGSTDGTWDVIESLAARHAFVRGMRKPNSGHGRTCLAGYRLAIESGARFILQIDSDGQCDPRYFPAFWSLRHRSPLVFGFRKVRDDGSVRQVISRLTALGVWLAGGVRVRDPNVPYRLMHSASVAPAVAAIGDEVDLVNVYLAAALGRRLPIRWVDMTFRARAGGVPHHDVRSIARRGLIVLRQIARARLDR